MDFLPSGARRAAALVLIISTGTGFAAESADPAADSQSAGAASSPGTTVLTGRELLATGQTELTQALAQLLPSLHLSLFSANDGSDHVRSLSAYGLSPDQVVVLVNGKRRHKAALLNLADAPGRGSVGTDLSMLPLHAVERVEISTGSSADQRVAGAVAAVINVVLDESSSGTSLDLQYGINLGEVTGVPDVTFTEISGGTVRLIEAGDRNVDDGDGDTVWIGGSWGFDIGERGFMRFSGDFRDQDATNRAGYDPRELYARQGDGSLDPREETADRLNHRYGQAEVEQFNLLVNAAMPVSDRMTLYGLITIGSLRTNTAADFRRPVDVRNVLEIYPDGFLPEIRSDIDDRAFVVGLTGEHFGWSWDLALNTGENEIDWTAAGTLNASMGELSPTKFSTGNNEYHLRTFGIEAHRPFGENFHVSIGAEMLAEEYEVEKGETASTINGGFTDVNGDPAEVGSQGFPGFKRRELEQDRDVYSVFAKVDADLSERTRLSATARYDDYDDVGGIFGGRLAGNFQLTPAIALRASAAMGAKAPELSQGNYEKTVTVFDTGAPAEAGNFPSDSDVALALGGGSLTEEEFVSFDAGITLEPLPSLILSADFYRIEVDDAVVLTDTLAGDALVGVLDDAGVNDVARAAFFLNGADTRAQGVNLAARYPLQTRYGQITFSLNANFNENKVTNVDEEPAELAAAGLARLPEPVSTRLEDGRPESRTNLTVDWQRERLGMRMDLMHYGKTTDATAGFELDSDIVLNLSARYQATPRVALDFGAHNILDALPDPYDLEADDATDFDRIYPFSRYSPYGINGRLVYLRASVRFD
jgi:iron complex outermembrane receptor protein